MGKLYIEGNNILSGTIEISGSKNSAVALIPASLLCDEKVVINNVPEISDIDALIEILEYLEVEIIRNGDTIIIDPINIKNKMINEEISKKLRASYYFMSALLGRFKKVEMYFPGGCNIGKRPIDQTLKGFAALGATIDEAENKYNIYTDELKGAVIDLDMPSVGATINSIFASVKAKGITTINNAAKEPEIGNVIDFLNKMGAKIRGKDTSCIKVEGVEFLSGCSIDVIPDRIEAGTYVILGALVGNNLKISKLVPEHIKALLNKLDEMGVKYLIHEDSIIISKGKNLNSVNIKTEGYPGFATDLQQPITVLLTQCNGISILEETIYENRFQNVEYLNKMGATIKIIDRKIEINGYTGLFGEEVKATDLRAGACMVLAALTAEGKTEIDDIEHVLRGYENIVQKLKNVGAKIKKD